MTSKADINDTLRKEGTDAARARSDKAKKHNGTDAPSFTPWPLKQVLDVFDQWLLLCDPTPIYAVLGTVAANYLDGDPVWTGIIGPPSSAKTEILNSTSLLPDVVQAATLTMPGLLSGTPKKQ